MKYTLKLLAIAALLTLIATVAVIHAGTKPEPAGAKYKIFALEVMSVKPRGADGIGIDSTMFLKDSLLENWGVRDGYRLHSLVVAAPATTPGGPATVWAVFEKE